MAARRRRNRQRKQNVMEIKKKPRGEVEIEVIDITESDGEEVDEEQHQQNGGLSTEEDVEEEEELLEEGDDGGYTTKICFGEDSVGNDVVTTFFLDCLSQPKIFCHRVFRPLREFIQEATDLKLETSVVPWEIDHEDNKVYLDRGEEWLKELKTRYKSKQQGGRESEDDEEGEEFGTYWANFIPVERKTDLGLTVWTWTPTELSCALLEMYLLWCKEKYVPPTPKPKRMRRKVSPSAPKRTTRASWKRQIEEPEEPVVTPQVKTESKDDDSMTSSVEPEDNGLDERIKDFVKVFDITKNCEAEERYNGDIQAKEQRRHLNKVEPHYDRELNLMVAHNRSIRTVLPYKSRKDKSSPERRSNSDSDSDSRKSPTLSTSSSNSSDSDYKGPRRRKPAPDTKRISPTKPRNGIVSRGAVKKPSEPKPSSSSSIPFFCRHCKPPQRYSSRRSLYKHLSRVHTHSSAKQYVKCACNRKILKERWDFHKRVVCAASRKQRGQ